MAMLLALHTFTLTHCARGRNLAMCLPLIDKRRSGKLADVGRTDRFGVTELTIKLTVDG